MQNHRPVNDLGASKLDGAAHFGKSSKQQVGTNSHIGLDIKEENKYWCHERAAAHSGEANNQAHQKSSQNKVQIVHGVQCSLIAIYLKLFFSYVCMTASYKLKHFSQGRR